MLFRSDYLKKIVLSYFGGSIYLFIELYALNLVAAMMCFPPSYELYSTIHTATYWKIPGKRLEYLSGSRQNWKFLFQPPPATRHVPARNKSSVPRRKRNIRFSATYSR